jgi:hypothetical protein
MQAEQIFGVSCRTGCDLGPWAKVAHATKRKQEKRKEASVLMGGWEQDYSNEKRFGSHD